MNDLSGRLSLVEIGDYVILTSEGKDQGFVIHVPGSFSVSTALHSSLRSGLSEFLGVEAPDISVDSDFAVARGAGSNQLQNDYHFYKLTYVAASRIGNIESPASERHSINYRQTPNQGAPLATLRNIPPASGDSRVEAVRIYRSGGAFDLFENDANIRYYRVGEVEIDADAVTIDDDNYELENGEIVIDVSNPLMDNSRMPSSISRIERFNDRLFGANGNELRYSDVRNAIPLWHVWPVLNAITTGQRIGFCAEYRGILLFGAADNLHRLSGASPPYRYDRIAARGPISPYAWGVLEKAFGFVGSDGLYLTDGTQAPEIAPQLKGYFNRYEVEDGFVGMLPNKASLWGVNRRNKSTGETDSIYFVNEGNDWIRIAEGLSEINRLDKEQSTDWMRKEQLTDRSSRGRDSIASATEIPDGSHIRQYASVKFDGLPLTGVIADLQRAPRLIDWVVDDASVDEITHYTGSTPIKEEIAWSWESQQLDWNSHGLGSEMKTFKELVIDGKAENDITVTFYIDEQQPVAKTVSTRRTGGERFDHRRIRIDRRGFALRFKIAGAGGVTIRGMKVRAYA